MEWCLINNYNKITKTNKWCPYIQKTQIISWSVTAISCIAQSKTSIKLTTSGSHKMLKIKPTKIFKWIKTENNERYWEIKNLKSHFLCIISKLNYICVFPIFSLIFYFSILINFLTFLSSFYLYFCTCFKVLKIEIWVQNIDCLKMMKKYIQ